MKLTSLLRLSAAALLGLSACQTTSPGALNGGASTPPAPLRNTRWVLRQLGTAPISTPVDAREADLLLRPDELRAEGNAGCNRYSGTYEQSTPEQLRFDRLLSTKMACPNLDTETRFMQALGLTAYFRISGDTLRLYAGPPAETPPLARLEAVYTQ